MKKNSNAFNLNPFFFPLAPLRPHYYQGKEALIMEATLRIPNETRREELEKDMKEIGLALHFVSK